MDEVIYCGEVFRPGAICRRSERHSIHGGMNQDGSRFDGHHQFKPAFLSCPECRGMGVFPETKCPCKTSPTPGFIPVSEEVRT